MKILKLILVSLRGMMLGWIEHAFDFVLFMLSFLGAAAACCAFSGESIEMGFCELLRTHGCMHERKGREREKLLISFNDSL
jgi:hypothetical protein